MRRSSGGGRRERIDTLRRLLRTPGRRREALRASRALASDCATEPAAIRSITDELTSVGAYGDAIQINCEAMARIGPDPALLCGLGLAHLAADRPAEALTSFTQAAGIDPRRAEPKLRIGQALTRLMRFGPAVAALQEAAAIHRDDFETELALGVALQHWGRAHRAIPHFRAALARRPDSAEAANGLALSLRLTGEFDAALEAYRRAAACSPDSSAVVAGQAETLIALDRTNEARSLLEPLLRSDAPPPAAAVAYARIARKDQQIPAAIETCRACLAAPGISTSDRIALLFSLGAMHEQSGDCEAAFDAFAEANSLYASDQFSIDGYREFVDRLIETFDPARLRSLARSDATSERPIFIVGVPRSGTSLVEQILAAHPDVFGAGELPDIAEACLDRPSGFDAAAEYPDCLTAATAPLLNGIAREHLEQLAELGGASRFVTDKLPGNFQHLGLIWMLLPGARVIHCRRDPVDTCLSCFTTMLSAAHAYSHSLENLGRFYREYERLMAHWHAALDLPMLDVEYERLVAEPEEQTRRLLRFCGLGWDDACLRFHESKRVALTASMDQVRRPIYKTSVNRAARYGARLDPLRRALAGDC